MTDFSPTTLASLTDLLVLRAMGAEAHPRGDHWAVRFPGHPTFYWGNYLMFGRAPIEGDFARWNALFEAEFADEPQVRHRAFAWDDPEGPNGHLEPFVEAGFEPSPCILLAAEELVRPPHFDGELRVRPLESDGDWSMALENQVASNLAEFGDGFRPFKERHFEVQRRVMEAGAGRRYGAFDGDRLVGDLGLIVSREGRGLARFDSIVTAASHRRRGVCRSLVYRAFEHASEHLGAKTFVLVAEEGAPAARVYRDLGFEQRERLMGIEKRPPGDGA